MDNKGKKTPDQPFTHSLDVTGEVPTLTTLLNRKKLVISSESRDAQDVTRPITSPNLKAAEEPKPVTQAAPETKETSQSKILPAARSRKGSLPTNQTVASSNKNSDTQSIQRSELLLWDPAMMAKSPNPFANALAQVMRLIPEGLYMAITKEGGPGRRVPLFKSHAAFTGSEERMRQLTGIYWDPEYYPDLWKSLLQTGVAETGPSMHEPLKAKFGYPKEVTLLIALVGPANACRGLAVFASQKSIRDEALKILGPLYVLRPRAA